MSNDHRNFPWNQEIIDQLVVLWVEGLSTSAITGAINAKVPVGGAMLTKSSVCAKVSRLRATGHYPQLAERTKSGTDSPADKGSSNRNKRILSVRPPAHHKPAVPSMPKVQESKFAGFGPHEKMAESIAKNGKSCGILQLTNKTCRWPIGDPRAKDFTFCGSDIEGQFDGAPGQTPYCSFHRSLAYEARKGKVAASPHAHPVVNIYKFR